MITEHGNRLYAVPGLNNVMAKSPNQGREDQPVTVAVFSDQYLQGVGLSRC